MKSLLACIFLVISCAVFAKESPLDVIYKSIDVRRSLPYIVIHSSPLDGNMSNRLVMKWEQDGKGNTRSTVIAPLSMQGTTSIIDPRYLTSIFPDQKRIVQIPAKNILFRDLELRKDLIPQNYTLSFSKEIKVANRRTFTVVAKAKEKGISTRRYCYDKSAYLLLRHEVLNPKTKLFDLILDTFSADFPAKVTVDTSLGSREGFERIIQSPSPTTQSFDEAMLSYGWKLSLPEEPILGFMVEQVNIMIRGPRGLAGIRMTDGLTSVTVYLWRSKYPPDGFDELELPKLVTGDFTMIMAGDLPTSFHETLLKAIDGEMEIAQDLQFVGTQDPFQIVLNNNQNKSVQQIIGNKVSDNIIYKGQDNE